MKVFPLSISRSDPNGAILGLVLVVAVFQTPSTAFLAPNPVGLQSSSKSLLRDQPRTLPTQPFMMARPTTTTVLHLNLVDRFLRVARGNANSVLSRFEDPEKVMDQALLDMQNDLTKIRQTYAEATAGQRRLLSQKIQYESVAADWYRRAQLALKTNKESLAREALARREQILQKAATIQQQVDGQATTLDALYDGMKALEDQIQRAQSRKSELAARAKTAQSTVWVNEMLSGLSGTTSMDAFRRMEDKVVALEASAEASGDMLLNSDVALLSSSASLSSPKAPKALDLELEFKRLESSDAVDREIEALRVKMMLPSSEERNLQRIQIPVREVPLLTN